MNTKIEQKGRKKINTINDTRRKFKKKMEKNCESVKEH
jgi:hypothetical protein